MDVRLVLEKKGKRAQVLHLQSEETIVGRQKGCDLRIPSAEVSRRHCLFSTQKGYLTVEDLESANGTYVNDQLISGKQAVRPGDRITIGPVTFLAEYQLTQAAIDSILAEENDIEVVEDVEEVQEEPSAVELIEDEEPAPLEIEETEQFNVAEVDTDDVLTMEEEPVDQDEVFDAIVELDNSPGGQVPEGDKLRDILAGLEEDSPAPAPKTRKRG